jgi:hypothetical protein
MFFVAFVVANVIETKKHLRKQWFVIISNCLKLNVLHFAVSTALITISNYFFKIKIKNYMRKMIEMLHFALTHYRNTENKEILQYSTSKSNFNA